MIDGEPDQPGFDVASVKPNVSAPVGVRRMHELDDALGVAPGGLLPVGGNGLECCLRSHDHQPLGIVDVHPYVPKIAASMRAVVN
jgi:hypothetical protein